MHESISHLRIAAKSLFFIKAIKFFNDIADGSIDLTYSYLQPEELVKISIPDYVPAVSSSSSSSVISSSSSSSSSLISSSSSNSVDKCPEGYVWDNFGCVPEAASSSSSSSAEQGKNYFGTFEPFEPTVEELNALASSLEYSTRYFSGYIVQDQHGTVVYLPSGASEAYILTVEPNLWSENIASNFKRIEMEFGEAVITFGYLIDANIPDEQVSLLANQSLPVLAFVIYSNDQWLLIETNPNRLYRFDVIDGTPYKFALFDETTALMQNTTIYTFIEKMVSFGEGGTYSDDDSSSSQNVFSSIAASSAASSEQQITPPDFFGCPEGYVWSVNECVPESASSSSSTSSFQSSTASTSSAAISSSSTTSSAFNSVSGNNEEECIAAGGEWIVDFGTCVFPASSSSNSSVF